MTNFEIIEQYLEKEQDAGERAAFEQRLRNDPELARDFELYTAMQSDMEQWHQTEDERNALKQTLERVTRNKKTKVVPLRWYIWRVAALLIVVLGIWQVIDLNRKGASGKALYEEYAAKEKFSSGSRSGGTGNLWSDAESALFDKNYPAAINALQQIIAGRKDLLYEASFYVGFCYMKIDNDSAALRYFTQTPLVNGDTKERSLWYRILLHLKKGERKLAESLVDSVANGDGVYKLQAQELKKRL